MAIDELDERLLVKAYQAGDPRAFDTIVRTQWRALYAHAMRRLADHESAEDAVQDTLLRAYRALPNLSGDLALRAWLHRILTNVCHDEGNRRRRQVGLVERVSALPIEDAPDPVEEAILHDTVRVMSEALGELPDTYREALVLRYVDGLSFREVADVTGISEENARARVHRGRLALSKVLSRITVMLAFLIPGLKRAQETPAASTDAATEHVSLVTQLTSHALNAAPTVTRVASEMSALPSGKSALLTGAIAAAAAVSVPVAAYTVHEVTTPDRRPPAIAAPLDQEDQQRDELPLADGQQASETDTGATADAPVSDALDGNATTSTSVDSLPPSAIHPFEGVGESGATSKAEQSTTSTTEAPPADAGPTITGELTGDDLEAIGDGPNIDLSGVIALSNGKPAQLSGRLSVYDDGSVTGELDLTVDGVVHHLRLRGALVDDADPTDYFTGKFSLPTGDQLGLPVSGDVIDGRFERHGDRASLDLSIEGEQRSS